MAMRDDAYRVMTGKDAPLLDGYDPHPGLVAHGVVSDEHDPDSCEADCCKPVPTLGCRVAFDYSDIIYRQQVKPDMFQHPIREPFRKKWLKTEWVKRGNHRYGVLVGIRTLSDGTIDWSFDEPVTFYPETYFTAYLVAFDLRRKPVFLLPDDVEVLR